MAEADTTSSIADLLAAGGKVSQRLGGDYEPRPQQVEMARAVESAFKSGRHLIAEAGTGVGKSFAYLLPAIDAAVARKKRVVVSTHTISLQEQIVDKDVPLLRGVYGNEFSAVLVKGRGNYICQRRLDAAFRRQAQLFESKRDLEALSQIYEWAGDETHDGSLSSLPVQPDSRVWEKVRAEAGNCLGKRCPHYKGCYWQAAKRRMNTGNLLVVNHALFFSDLALRLAGVQYLPKYDHVVFDEAHTLEDVAAQHFGIRVGEAGIDYSLRHLFDAKRTKGFLATLANSGADVGKVNTLIEKTAEARHVTEAFFERCLSWRDRFAKDNGRVRQAEVVENDLSPRLTEIVKGLKDLAAGFGDDDDDPTKLELKLETQAQAEKLRVSADAIEAVIGQTMPDAVYWFDATGRTPRRCTLHASPVDISTGLKLALWSKTPGCVLTSATLSTAGKAEDAGLDYTRRRLGLDEATGVQYGSPFDYQKQARLIIETGLPEPSDRRFNEQAAERILHWIEETNGGAFVLFTSYSALIDAANRLHDELEDLGLPLFVQGQRAPRKVLLDGFRKAGNGVLFGTASFWQGVDVRGEALRNVIIHKLPFAVPDEPVTQARLERIKAGGGNGFMDYSVPEAVIKLKQGFGRLIRSAADKGIVVILDGRIATRRYGSVFLDALPDVEIERVDHRRGE